MKDLTTAVLNVAVTRAERATRRSYRRARHPANHRPDRTSNHGSGDYARCGASCLLRRLAGRDRKTDTDCKQELSHVVSPPNRKTPAYLQRLAPAASSRERVEAWQLWLTCVARQHLEGIVSSGPTVCSG